MMEDYWDKLFKKNQPTWMENWYEELKDYTIKSSYFRLNQKEVNAMIEKGIGRYYNNEEMRNIVVNIEKARIELNYSSLFVRLGSRSPKDIDTMKYSTFISMLCDSGRVLEDLMLCSKVNYNPYIFLRKNIRMEKRNEFRCFVKDNKLVGISQYFYRDRYYHIDDDNVREHIIDGAERLLQKIIDKINLKDFVFDIYYRRDKDLPLLIELNPWSDWTDSCLFDWATDNFENFEFRWFFERERRKKR